jgi:hypothetical protein
MGLDMYAYVGQQGQREEYYEGDGDFVDGEWTPKNGVPKPREIAYWRKHPNLHGWMEQLWLKKSRPGIAANCEDADISFNGIELELVWEDLDELERAVTHKQLPSTSGFFFGNSADEVYYKDDLEFIKNAKAELFLGLKVFYNSSW